MIQKSLRKIGIWLLVCTLLCGCGSAGQESKEEMTARAGRYTERELETPGRNYTEVIPAANGGYVFCGEEQDAVLISEDGTRKEITPVLARSNTIHVEAFRAVSPVGGVMVAYYPFYTDKQYEELSEKELFTYSYLLVDENGKKRELELSGEGFSPYENLEYFSFVSDGGLYACDTDGTVFQVDLEQNRLLFLFQTDSMIEEFCLCQHVLVALDDKKAWLYDLDKGELLQDNENLNEFVAAHRSEEKSIVLCTDEKEQTLYLGCRNGLYQYIWDGLVIEQIADGQYLTLGNSYYKPVMLQCVRDDVFRIFFSPERFVELYYDESLSNEPEKILTIYSLEENPRIRYGATLFMKNNPEVYVNYETGIQGDNAVDTEDALKKLNTKILAGEVPDLLVLDGMDIEQYAEKGILKDLDELVQPYLEEKQLYENIVDGMRMTADNHIYALPLTVQIPAWMSERSYFEGEEDLEDLVAGMEQARTGHPEGALLTIRGEEDLLNAFLFTCLPAWTDETNSLDVKKLSQFFSAMKRIWDLNAQGITEEDWESIRETFRVEEGYELRQMLMPIIHLFVEDLEPKHFWASFGVIPDVGAYSLIWQNNQVIRKYGVRDGMKDMKDAVIGSFHGQAQNVFWAQSLVGICENAQEPELAEDFYHLLLSDEMMNKWWLQKGLPISRRAMEYGLDVENNEYEQYIGIEERQSFDWPDEEGCQILLDLMEAATTFYQPGTSLEKTVKETGIRVCQGALTPEEGAQEVARRMAIEMEE